MPRNFPDPEGDMPPPDRPTAAAPGTAAKMTVLAERLEALRDLHHPDDFCPS